MDRIRRAIVSRNNFLPQQICAGDPRRLVDASSILFILFILSNHLFSIHELDFSRSLKSSTHPGVSILQIRNCLQASAKRISKPVLSSMFLEKRAGGEPQARALGFLPTEPQNV
jgi:hypothetical protein